MKIKIAKYLTSAIDKDHWIIDDISEICLLGRSNVGKSTFINVLCNQKKLAKISSVPGKTVKLNFFDINNGQFRLVDAPGYGYAKLSMQIRKDFEKMMHQYLTQRLNLKAAILLLDLRRIPNNDDILIYDFLKQQNILTIIIATKMDKVKRNDIKKQEKIISECLKITVNDYIIISSSITKVGYDKIIDLIGKIIV